MANVGHIHPSMAMCVADRSDVDPDGFGGAVNPVSKIRQINTPASLTRSLPPSQIDSVAVLHPERAPDIPNSLQ